MSSKKAASLPTLSPAEQALMDLIWQKQPVSTGDLLQAVNQDRPEPITRSTLQTQLTRLEAKGWLLSDDTGKARLYHSALSEKGGRGKVLDELKQRFFGGSGLSLVRCLVEDGGLTDAEMAELNQLIETHRKGTRP
jgi:predicted transcriptional regulator